MKKYTALFAAIALVFCALWFYELFDKSDAKEACLYYASLSASSFEEHEMMKEHFEDSSSPLANYWHGVSEFYAFCEHLRSLVGYEDPFYKGCRSLYHHMILIPDEVATHTFELTAALDRLSENYESSEGRKTISDLSYLFQYGVYPQ